jgi:hypothetical protein
MSVSVSVGPNEGVTGVHHYRVTVNLYWYGSGGSTIIGSSRHRVDFYKGVMGTQHWVDSAWCASLSPS